MMLNEVTTQAGAHKRRKRVGRGEGSGWGKTSTRGNKGCQARAGGGTRPQHEGGQMPMFRRVPKRGFSNVQFATEWELINVGRLAAHFQDGETVTMDALRTHRLVNRKDSRVKVLGKGALAKKLTVEAHAFSKGAQEAIENAGGKTTVLEVADPAAQATAKRFSKKPRPVKPAKVRKPAAEAAPPAPPPKEQPAPEAGGEAEQPE